MSKPRCSCGRSDVGRHVMRYSKKLERMVCIHAEDTGGAFGEEHAPRMEIRVQPDCSHVSRQHPPGWKAHEDAGGEFDSKGRTIMPGLAQIERSVKIANEKYGENVTWDGFREIR